MDHFWKLACLEAESERAARPNCGAGLPVQRAFVSVRIPATADLTHSLSGVCLVSLYKG